MRLDNFELILTRRLHSFKANLKINLDSFPPYALGARAFEAVVSQCCQALLKAQTLIYVGLQELLVGQNVAQGKKLCRKWPRLTIEGSLRVLDDDVGLARVVNLADVSVECRAVKRREYRLQAVFAENIIEPLKISVVSR